MKRASSQRLLPLVLLHFEFNKKGYFLKVFTLFSEKMKALFPLALLFISLQAFSQEPKKNMFQLEGYIFSEDSVPAENAHLINYRTSKIVTTDSKGFFRTSLQQGDSLMVNHVSLTPMIIYTGTKMKNEAIRIYVPYRTYVLKAISSGNYEKEKEHVEESMKQVKRDIESQIIVKPYLRTNENPYDNDKLNPGITIPILQIGSKEKKKTPPAE